MSLEPFNVTTSPEEIFGLSANAVTIGLGDIVICCEAVLAHCPWSGVNVYNAGSVLLIVAGLHVPVIPFTDVVGNVGALPPLQIVVGVISNVGGIPALTVTVIGIRELSPHEPVTVWLT